MPRIMPDYNHPEKSAEFMALIQLAKRHRSEYLRLLYMEQRKLQVKDAMRERERETSDGS